MVGVLWICRAWLGAQKQGLAVTRSRLRIAALLNYPNHGTASSRLCLILLINYSSFVELLAFFPAWRRCLSFKRWRSSITRERCKLCRAAGPITGRRSHHCGAAAIKDSPTSSLMCKPLSAAQKAVVARWWKMLSGCRFAAITWGKYKLETTPNHSILPEKIGNDLILGKGVFIVRCYIRKVILASRMLQRWHWMMLASWWCPTDTVTKLNRKLLVAFVNTPIEAAHTFNI